MKASEIARIVNGKLIGEDLQVNSFEFDSRKCGKGSLFIALKGNRDGHDFINDAFEKGAVGALASKKHTVPAGRFLVLVEDTLKGFSKIASQKRKGFKGTVIAVTGSVGKTTTKELLSHFLSKRLSVYFNTRSYNNLIGVSYTLSNLPNNAEVYVQELGTNKKGEIKELTEIVKPDIAVVTYVGKAHTENFGSFKEIVEEKLSITESAEIAVVPYEFREYSRGKKTITFGKMGYISLQSVKLSPEGTEFILKIKDGKEKFFTPIPGYSVVNATMVAAAIALEMDIPLKELKEAVLSFQPPEMRMNVLKLKGTTVINDAYNANPISMANAIKVLSTYSGKKIAVLGEMLELDNAEEEHRKLGELLKEHRIDTVIATGENAAAILETFNGEAYHFVDRKEFLNFIKRYEFSNATVLVKGSRANRLEEVVEILKKRYRS